MAIIHIFFAPMPTWGHIHPVLLLSARLIQENPDIHVTLCTAGNHNEKSYVVLPRYFDNDKVFLVKNIRVVSLAGDGDRFFNLVGPWLQEFPSFYTSLYHEKELVCNKSGRTFPGLPKPKCAIVDMFGIDLYRMIRSTSKHEVPIYAWQTGGSTVIFWFTAPEEYGGIGDVAGKSQELAKTLGKTPREIEYDFWHPTAGGVVKLPGVGELYDYECSLQLGAGDIEAIAHMDGLHTHLHSGMKDCDGLIMNNNPPLEPEATEAFRKLFRDTGRPIFCIGPMVASYPDLKKFVDADIETSVDGQRILTFLNRIRKTHGERSLLLVSFGTFFWPSGLAIWHFLDEAIIKGIPMLITHDETQGKIPDSMVDKLHSNENILIVRWSPQIYLLNNPTVGWFLSHCGNNSTQEAFCSGVPVIACPIDGDQPMTATYISDIHKLGFQLIEGRDWIGDRPFRRGLRRKGTEEGARDEARRVLDQAFGPEGEIYRKNVQAFRAKMRACWEGNGESRKDLLHLLQTVSSK